LSQPALFDLTPSGPRAGRGRLDAASEAFLDAYRTRYRSARSERTIRGEISQLRTVAREAASTGAIGSISDVLADTSTLATILTAPKVRPSATTALIRLGAINAALLMLYGADEGRLRIAALDAALPKRDGVDWYQSGVVLAGRRERQRAQSPTIEPSDLPAIVEAAAADKGAARARRDRLLVATHCFSGLEVSEIAALNWSDLHWESEADAWSVTVSRGGTATPAVIFGVAASLMIRFRLEADPAARHVFTNSRGETLTARQVRRIVVAACSASGFPLADRSTLLSAAAAYLGMNGLTDHEIAMALAIRDMRTVNRLLKPHQRLRAQRTTHGVAYFRR
jgi:integrase